MPFCGYDSVLEKHDAYALPDMRGVHYAARYPDTPGAWNALIHILDSIQS